MAAHRYWRVLHSTIWGGTQTYLQGLEFRDSNGTNQSTTGNGTASASAEVGGFEASKAFDNNTGTFWGASITSGWIKWDFGAGNEKDIQQTVLINHTVAANAIRQALIQYSDDDTNWTKWATVSEHPSGNNIGTSYSADVPGAITGSIPIGSLSVASGASVELDGIMPTAAIAGGANITIAPPMPRATLVGHDATGEYAITAQAPMATVELYGGAHIAARLPMPTAAMVGTGTAIGSLDIAPPMQEVALIGFVGGLATLVATLPSAEVSGYFGGVISATCPMGTIEVAGAGGAVGRLAVTLPMAEVTLVATQDSHGAIEGAIPMPYLAATARLEIMGIMPLVSIVGSATVVASYEAYAVNLKAATDKDGKYQVSRYTNYPFDVVLRFQGAYYGIGAAGIFLLEGTTDYADPTPTKIPWNWKTATHDFGSPLKKTVVSAYFSGRLGAHATVTLYAGEESDQQYAFELPRGVDIQNHRQKFGRGVKQRYHALGVAGEDDFDLDGIEFEVTEMTRRI